MNKKTAPIATFDYEMNEYIPMNTFLEFMAKANELPYKSELSVESYYNKLKELAGGTCQYTKEIVGPMFNKAKHHFSEHDFDFSLEDTSDDELQRMLGTMFPAMFLDNQMSFIAPPFKKQFRFKTPAARAFFSSEDWMMKVDPEKHQGKYISTTIRAGAFLLEKFYNVKPDEVHSQVFTMMNVKTKLQKHFKVEMKNEFVQAKAVKPLKNLNKKQISKLLNNVYDEELWLEALPVENFEFSGFLIGTFHDVTGLETMSILKDRMLLSEEEMNPELFFPFLEQQLRNYLVLPELRVGMVMVTYGEFFQGQSFSLTGTNDVCLLKGSEEENSIYKKAFKKISVPILITDIAQFKGESKTKDLLLNNDIKSLILYPMLDSSGNISSILEIGVPTAMTFNSLTLLRLKEFFNLISLGSDQYLQTMSNMISLFIQNQFTSIHSSVQWKFEEVATKYQVRQPLPDFDGMIDPIVFKDIYPLYGQADIVGSSNLRNNHIQEDLLDNLVRVLKLMHLWNNEIKFHLLEAYILKAEQVIARLEKEFISSDESLVVDLLTREIHPLLEQLNRRYDALPSEPYAKYLKYLDPDLNIIYNKRKAYEQSVSQLNSAISNFVEEDDRKMQKILPHYFEKYTTDGVEYNIYVGDSLLRDGGFSPFFLKDFRIWQLVNACEITRLVEKVSPTLPVPLQTAQLIFIYNNQLSIRFRMDEKQFDVDGTYNVRYEILKKRIDKAVIKETGERLTVAGKIAIVYLQQKDRAEYMEYLEYLVQKGYISSEIEDLELQKLQGAEGLKALRVTVV